MANASKQILSLVKGIDLLLLFAEAPTLGIREIAGKLKSPPSTIYRFVRTLQAKGVLHQDLTTKKYTLGPQLLSLAFSVLGRLDIRAIALPHMRELAAASGETVQLMVRRDYTSVCVEVIESAEGLRVSPPPGRCLPLHAGALAKVILAFLSPAEIDTYLSFGEPQAFTSKTITDRDALRAELARIRALGYAISSEEVYAGAAGVAAPIFNRTGEVIASLGVSGPLSRLSDHKAEALAPAVRQYAQLVSNALRPR
jgi:IclR family transcriptional regulator, acetate operon repressor